jgi:hypothetical protein
MFYNMMLFLRLKSLRCFHHAGLNLGEDHFMAVWKRICDPKTHEIGRAMGCCCHGRCLPGSRHAESAHAERVLCVWMGDSCQSLVNALPLFIMQTSLAGHTPSHVVRTVLYTDSLRE